MFEVEHSVGRYGEFVLLARHQRLKLLLVGLRRGCEYFRRIGRIVETERRVDIGGKMNAWIHGRGELGPRRVSFDWLMKMRVHHFALHYARIHLRNGREISDGHIFGPRVSRGHNARSLFHSSCVISRLLCEISRRNLRDSRRSELSGWFLSERGSSRRRLSLHVLVSSGKTLRVG
jgi:hypothetical protein